ncbi:MAG: DMT family transporter [Rhodospirillales bacterium]|nr:DMT family transporter [Rhodospirillales bacterium]
MTLLSFWWRQAPGTLKGATWIILASVCFALMSVTIRLAANGVDPLEVVFFRNVFNLLFMLPWFLKIGLAGLRTERVGLHFIRTASSLTSMFLWFTALTMLPLAEATSLSFTAPLFATVGAALFLAEDVRLRRWLAVGLGFVGALIILRPGIEVVTPGALLMLTGSVFVATSILLVKVLSRTESPNTMVLMVALIATPISAIPLFWVWEMPQGITWLWLACVGAAATGGHLCFNRAMVNADASAVLPYEYTRLIFVALIGFFLFSEVPDAWTWVGSLVIFGAGIYIANREIAAREAGRKTR